MEHFTISDKHYLAVANSYNGASHRLNSLIYQWNGTQFVVFQTIPTNNGRQFDFFKISLELFLAVTNARNNSVIYKWKNNQFEKFQEIGNQEVEASTAFVINSETFIAFANLNGRQPGSSSPSNVFKWSGGSFVKVQSLKTHGAYAVKSFTINCHTFLAFAMPLYEKSFIYKWDGAGHFVLFPSIPTRGAMALHPFVMCGQTFLGVAAFGKSFVYQASGERLIKHQEISTQAAKDLTSFEYNGDIYLVIVNFANGNRKYNINSVLYKWIKKET